MIFYYSIKLSFYIVQNEMSNTFQVYHNGRYRQNRPYQTRTFQNFTKRRVISSYGIVLCSLVNGSITYQMIQRRDSIPYDQFLKDSIKPEEMIMYLSSMSREEKNRCLEYIDDFDQLWNDLWINHNCKQYLVEFDRCKLAFKYNMTRYGDYIRDVTKDKLGFHENPWQFPRGRKQMYESELNCALREFEEETLVPKNSIQVVDLKPYEEFYTGMDRKQYRSVYFVAYTPTIPKTIYKDMPNNIRKKYISSEVIQIQWFSLDECLKRLLSPQQKETMIRIHNSLFITKGNHIKSYRKFNKEKSHDDSSIDYNENSEIKELNERSSSCTRTCAVEIIPDTTLTTEVKTCI